MTAVQTEARDRALANLRTETLERVRQVQTLRERREHLAAVLASREAAFRQTIATETAELEAVKTQLALAERTVKELALDAFRADPANKQPAPGVGIRVSRSVEYDRATFLTWAKQKGLFLIPESLDTKALEKFLLGQEPGSLDVPYRIVEEPVATLASDLTKALAGGEG